MLTFLLYAFVVVVLLVVVVLIGVMLGRGDANVSHAVQQIFVKVDSQRDPMLPSHYKTVAPDVLLIVGDAWAGGDFVTDPSSQAWWAQMHARTFPLGAVIRVTNSSATTQSLPQLTASVNLQNVRGKNVLIVIQCGINDLVAAHLRGQLSAINVRDMANAVIAAANSLLTPALLSAASVRVFIIDYADVTANTGYTSLACEAPYDGIFNYPGAASEFLNALSMYSQALFTASHAESFAFVPLRDTLANVGSIDVTHALSPLHHKFVGVRGQPLSLDAIAAFTGRCGTMGVMGQGYQADLVAAYALNKRYFIVG